MTMFNKVVKSFKYGDHNVRLETGEIARQASGAVICDMDDLRCRPYSGRLLQA